MNVRWHINFALVKMAVALLKLTGWYDGYWNVWRTIFPYVEQRGLHIMPVHYYSPIPDVRHVLPEDFERARLPAGFDLNCDAALELLSNLVSKYDQEFEQISQREAADPHIFSLNNAAFGSGDAEVLYGMIRDRKPHKIIEIGSGYSTLLICEAIRQTRLHETGYNCEFVAIEPFPPNFLRSLPPEVSKLEARPLQELGPELFSSLRTNDILFIDSSHVVALASDVVREFLTILPTLAPGVLVHIHDIFIPYEYPQRWLNEFRFFWNEQYLLEAFLTFNSAFEVVLPLHALWKTRRDQYDKLIRSPDFNNNGPGSFWIRKL